MSTKLILDGRVVYRSEKPNEPVYTPIFKEPLVDESIKRLRAADNYATGPWNIRYRRVVQLGDRENWLTMPDLLKISYLEERDIVQMVNAGELDAVMIEGSNIPLFRILDRIDFMKRVLNEMPRSPAKPKEKVQWHKI